MGGRNTAAALLILLSLVLVVAAGTEPAGARDRGPTADGRGFFAFRGETTFFSFHAKGHRRGDDKGRARFDNLTAGTGVDVRIACMNIDSSGSSANFRGVVTKSDDPEVPEGSVVFFAVTDWDALGSERPDEITPLFLDTFGGACEETPFPLTLLPVIDVDIRVRP